MQFNMIFLEYTFWGLSCLPLWLLASLGAFLLGWLLDWLFSSRGKDVVIRDWEEKYNRAHERNITWEKDYATLKYKLEEAEGQLAVVKNNLQICEADKQVLNAKLNQGIGAGIVAGTSIDSSALTDLQAKYSTLETQFNTVQESLKRCETDNLALTEKLTDQGGTINTGALGAVAGAVLAGSSTISSAEYETLKTKNVALEAEIATLKGNLQQCETDKAALSSKVEVLGAVSTQKLNDVATPTIDNAGIGAVVGTGTGMDLSYGTIFTEDNLQIVEGIGPKIESLLKENGINTWKKLSTTEPDELREILRAGGSRFKMHDPGSWPQQATFAAAGKWQELIAYQHQLSGGMLVTDGKDNPAKIEKMGMKILGFSNNPEDLKIVEGIGPKIEQLLKADGINTWAQLANTEVSRLQDILNRAGKRYQLAAPSTWPKQADLAAKGQWSDLTEYQDYLQGGKEPGK